MMINRFRRMAEAYGADIDRWPVDAQAEALRLLDRSAEARAAWAQAQQLDRWLDEGGPTVDVERTERVMAAIGARLDGRAVPGFVPPPSRGARAVWPSAAFLAVMGVLGLVVGTAMPPAPATITIASADDGVAGLIPRPSNALSWLP